MDITIDTSAILAVCTNEGLKPRLVELTVGARLLAPVSVHSEVGNALSAMLKRERITLAQALACLDAYKQIPVKCSKLTCPMLCNWRTNGTCMPTTPICWHARKRRAHRF